MALEPQRWLTLTTHAENSNLLTSFKIILLLRHCAATFLNTHKIYHMNPHCFGFLLYCIFVVASRRIHTTHSKRMLHYSWLYLMMILSSTYFWNLYKNLFDNVLWSMHMRSKLVRVPCIYSGTTISWKSTKVSDVHINFSDDVSKSITIFTPDFRRHGTAWRYFEL